MTRVSAADHKILQDISSRTGMTHQEIIHEALDSYQRDRLLDSINEGYSRLKSDKKKWAEVIRERRQLEAADHRAED